MVCDIREQGEVRAAVATVSCRTGRIDVLVNNAGIISVMPFAHAQPEDFQDSLDTHFWGPYYLTRACLPYLSRHNGRIVNISSIGGRVAVPHLLPYTVGKFALVGLSEGLHAELAASGVSVTTVAPHLMQTGSHRNALVRGRHREEATWFALGTSTRLVALDAHRAARAIVRAARARKASLVLGWQARVAGSWRTRSLQGSPRRQPPRQRDGCPPPRVARLATSAAGLATCPSARWRTRFFASAAARDLNQNLAPDEG